MRLGFVPSSEANREISGLDMNVLDVQDPTNLSAASFANPHYARTGGRTMRLQAKLTF